MDLRTLVGSGDRIGSFLLPFLVAGVTINARDPQRFAVGGSSRIVRAGALVMFACGVLAWAWSAALILTKVPRGELITSGPYAIVKHPLYTSVALLVLPAAGLLRNTWLGTFIGVAMFAGSRRFAPDEEEALSTTFGAAWESYCRTVRLPWL
jgi:protein-S-isoprenylcysteine O-methyltransferase Ste14